MILRSYWVVAFDVLRHFQYTTMWGSGELLINSGVLIDFFLLCKTPP